MPADSVASPETIRRTAREIVARPEYRLEEGPTDDSLTLRLMLRVLEWLFWPIQWLAERMSWMPMGLQWVVAVLLVLIVLALVGHVVWSIAAAVRGPKRGEYGGGTEAERRDPERLEREADAVAERGDFLRAVRLLFRAVLLRLEEFESRRFRPGTTNREHLRRLSGTPLFDDVRTFVETIDDTWYGTRECGHGEYAACRSASEQIRRRTTRSENALGA